MVCGFDCGTKKREGVVRATGKPMTAKELIDRIAPQHDRTSCNDTDLKNAFANDQGAFRCARCTLLLGVANEHFEDRIVFSVSASDKIITDAVAAVNAAERQLATARRNLESVR